MDRLTLAMAASTRAGVFVGLIYIDLDGFKAINDTAGHGAGDEVLVATAARLRALVRPGDTVARLGGDEFVVLCPTVTGDAEIRAVADRIVGALARPVVVDGTALLVGASSGTAVSRGTPTAEALLRAADQAMYADKHQRRDLFGDPRSVIEPVRAGPSRSEPV